MSDRDDLPPGDEPGAIGVGMGGSCPTCRAPVDLGQEFCLECGSPIRFTPRQRKPQRGATRTAPAAAARTAPAKSGFPWVPFLVVLALIGGGVALALVDNDGSSKSSSSKDATEPALPEITNETPPTTADSSTVTVDDCESTPLDQTQPALAGTSSDPDAATASTDGSQTATDPITGEQIPELDDGTGNLGGTDQSSFDGASGDVPSTDPSSGGTVTVDKDGNLCDGTNTAAPSPSTTGTDPNASVGTDTTATTTTPTTTGSTSSTTTGDWPSGTDGWTVIVAGYDTEARATQRAADLRADGYTDGGVLFSTDFQSLCPGIYVVFSGSFETEAKAKARKTKLDGAGSYAGTYVREIRTSGDRPSGCSTVSS